MQTAGYEWNGAEAIAVAVRPAFIGALPPGMRPIFTEGSGSVKKTFFGSKGNHLVKYSDGWQGGVGSNKKQRKFELGEWKGEESWSKQDYKDIVQEMAQDVKTAFQNDIFKSEMMQKIPFGLLGIDPGVPPTEESLVSMAEYLVLIEGVAQGILESFYLADTGKIVEKAEGAGTFPNGVTRSLYAEDVRFSEVDGLWKNIMSDVGSGDDDVTRITMSNGAVAQVNTITLTGTSGTATVAVKGVSKVATFDTDLDTTHANFVAANAAAYLAAGLVLTGTTTLVFTALHAGVGFDAGTVTNLTGDLAGGSVATTANTAAADLASGEALAAFRSMVTGQPRWLKSVPAAKKYILATDSMIENYQETLGAAGANMGTSESARGVMVEGTTQLKFNGIPIYQMPIDAAIDAYGLPYPHRAILAVPENLAPVLSSAGEFAEAALWWNKDENENRARVQLEMGGNYFLPELIVVAY